MLCPFDWTWTIQWNLSEPNPWNTEHLPKPDRLYSTNPRNTCLNQTDFTVQTLGTPNTRLNQTDFIVQTLRTPNTSLNQTDFTVQTLRTPNTYLNQTGFTVPSTKCLCNLNLCKPNTCLNWTNSSVPKGFGLDRFYCISYLIYSMKYWSCCRRKTTEFDNFLDQAGCETGKHLWIKPEVTSLTNLCQSVLIGLVVK